MTSGGDHDLAEIGGLLGYAGVWTMAATRLADESSMRRRMAGVLIFPP
jgi:hypothetical protein